MAVDARKMMADAKFYESYSRWIEEEGRKETWEEAVSRVMKMHRSYYADKMTPELDDLMLFAEKHYKEKHILGSQRALQFGGDQLLSHAARGYNCTVTHANRIKFFGETMYLLLCGAGVGFSVQRHHVAQLPDLNLARNPDNIKIFVAEDSIEGWADCFAALLSSYFSNTLNGEDYGLKQHPFPKLVGRRIVFDLSKIRPKGATISGGFKAPGPEPLRKALERVELLLEDATRNGQSRLHPIQVYDIIMHMSDAVLAGGVRRSATICLFDFDDNEMLNAKTGNWFITNPQRGRSNNSAMIKRDSITKEQFMELMKSVQEFGEPGFVFTDNLEFCYNPCVEIGMLPVTEDGRPGFEFCNLTEINGGYCSTPTRFYDACKAASIMGTLQAGYTNFKYLSKETKEIVEREALIGVSITGWMNNPNVLFDEDIMEAGATVVVETNKVVADIIGINHAARTTCVKPSGNASVLLGTASGIHGEHSPRYLRHVQMNKESDIAKAIMEANPAMCEESVWSANKTDIVIAFPIESPEKSIYKKDLYGVKQLEYVKKAQQVWVEKGTNVELSTDPNLRHNVSNTISVDNWDEVTDYVFENRQWFAGISFLGMSGDKDYAQAPFTEVLTPEELIEKYGSASMFASGLLVQGVESFGNLWLACDTVLGKGEDLGKLGHDNMIKHDFVRRAKKFAQGFFDGDVLKMTYCLKDVYNLHKWEKIQNSIKRVNWEKATSVQTIVDVDTMGAQACSGGACEIVF